MAIIHDDLGRRRFLSQAVMGFGLFFGLGMILYFFAIRSVGADEGRVEPDRSGTGRSDTSRCSLGRRQTFPSMKPWPWIWVARRFLS